MRPGPAREAARLAGRERLNDVVAEWLWREYGQTAPDRDWSRDAWRLLAMVRGIVNEYGLTDENGEWT